MSMRDELISEGVNNLRAYGYLNCNKDNILTNQLYKAFFASMLNDNKGHSLHVDKEIDGLLADCES